MVLRLMAGMSVLLLFSGAAAYAADGAAVYKAQCAKCHGETGNADTPIGKAMKAAVLAGDANIQKMTEADVVAKVKGDPKHPPAVKSLGDDELKAAAGFVKQLAGGK